MRSELGYREQSGQYTKFGEWYADKLQDPQYRNAPWCDMFIAWAADKAGVADAVGQFAWTPSHASWYIKQGAWSSVPEPGALVFYDWGGGKSYQGVDHVGIVEKVVGKKIHTIEANVDRVWLKRKVRSTDKVVGYGLPYKVKALREAQPSAPVLADDAPLQTFTVLTEERGSPFDLLGTPQALLALMVLTTVVVAFRLAGRRSGRHRRGLLSWNAPLIPALAAEPATASPVARKKPTPSGKPGSSRKPAASGSRKSAVSASRKPAASASASASASGKPARARSVPAKAGDGGASGTAAPHASPNRRKPYEPRPRPTRRDAATLGK